MTCIKNTLIQFISIVIVFKFFYYLLYGYQSIHVKNAIIILHIKLLYY